MVVADFLLKADEHSSQIRLAVPAWLTRPARQKDDTDAPVQPISCNPADTARILARIGPGEVRAEALLSRATITIRDLATLEPGDVLNLQCPLSLPLVMRVNGVEKYEGVVVPAGPRRAFAIQTLTQRPTGSP